MFATLQVLTTMAVAVAMAMSLAHALELPGKRRLDHDTYLAVQPIYYPGFTIGAGFGEVGGLVLTIILLFVTPPGTATFWLTAVAVGGMVGMFAVYWLITHRVNKVWLKDTSLSRPGATFFSVGGAGDDDAPDRWTRLRDRWEYSHVVRAVLALVSLLAMIIALRSG